MELLLDGYDHITDIVDDEDVPIIEAVSKANQSDTVSFLQSILAFEVRPLILIRFSSTSFVSVAGKA